MAILHGKPLLGKLLHIGFFLTAIPYPFLFIQYRSPLPGIFAWVILPSLSILTAMLIYSVFLEIPLATDNSGQLFRAGTYGFSRHPGFLWYTGVNILVAFYFLDGGIAMLCAALTMCNLLLVTVEDVLLFPRMFDGYDEYRKETPFLFSIHHVLHRRNQR